MNVDAAALVDPDVTRRAARRPSARRPLTVAVAALAAIGLLAGCSSSDDLADGYGQGSNQGYISGDGTTTEIAADDRGEPLEFSGETGDGDTIASDDLAGGVTIVNFWYASCPPCRVEAPVLEAVAQGFADQATFVGVNVYDEAPTAASFEREFGVSYPSIMDAASNEVQLAFSGEVPPNAVPTTIVLDRDNRVAARISGRVQEASILESMVQRVLDEAPDAAGGTETGGTETGGTS